jgi:hypothetical protein
LLGIEEDAEFTRYPGKADVDRCNQDILEYVGGDVHHTYHAVDGYINTWPEEGHGVTEGRAQDALRKKMQAPGAIPLKVNPFFSAPQCNLLSLT